MRIEDGFGADQFTAHITLEELDEICETMISDKVETCEQRRANM
jgi:hypothetical protein